MQLFYLYNPHLHIFIVLFYTPVWLEWYSPELELFCGSSGKLFELLRPTNSLYNVLNLQLFVMRWELSVLISNISTLQEIFLYTYRNTLFAKRNFVDLLLLAWCQWGKFYCRVTKRETHLCYRVWQLVVCICSVMAVTASKVLRLEPFTEPEPALYVQPVLSICMAALFFLMLISISLSLLTFNKNKQTTM